VPHIKEKSKDVCVLLMVKKEGKGTRNVAKSRGAKNDDPMKKKGHATEGAKDQGGKARRLGVLEKRGKAAKW